MLKIDVELDNGGHVFVRHKINDMDTFAYELVNGIDFIISELISF